MKTGNYAGFCDRGYKRNDPKNGDRLIEHGLILCHGEQASNPSTPQVPTPQVLVFEYGTINLMFNDKINTMGVML